MNVLCVLLMASWLASMVLDFTVGGLAHLLALAVVMIVILTEHRKPHRA